MTRSKIAVAYGDGIGPEIMEATLLILEESGASLEIEKIQLGEKVYLSGHPEGIEESSWETIKNADAFLKAPITTPQGGGYKSLNVTIRTALGLYANIRPCIAYHPFIQTKHPSMDVVVIRENEEDLYLGMEYKQTPHVSHSIKMISKEGSEKIIRYAFEYARNHSRKKVTCFTKDNIMKFSDGSFHKIFDLVAREYPDLEHEHWIVDIGAAKLADTPEAFDVLVLPNLYGDILSDVAAQISGSVGIAGSANIGERGAMFEAIHGSAPRRANQNIANPSGLILASVMMLNYLGQCQIAERIHNAWLKSIETGIHTYDIFKEGISREKVGTKEFAYSIVKFLGQKPSTLKSVTYGEPKKFQTLVQTPPEESVRRLVGIDIFIFSRQLPSIVTQRLKSIKGLPLPLEMITNRGAQIWPSGHVETFCIEQWRCRFFSKQGTSQSAILATMQMLCNEGFDVIKTENLYEIDGDFGFSSAPK